jgi:hypothetical protein
VGLLLMKAPQVPALDELCAFCGSKRGDGKAAIPFRKTNFFCGFRERSKSFGSQHRLLTLR